MFFAVADDFIAIKLAFLRGKFSMQIETYRSKLINQEVTYETLYEKRYF